MTCEQKWASLPPGSVVQFKGGVRLLRVTGEFEGTTVEIDTGSMGHLAEYVLLQEEYTGQFWVIK